MTKKLLILSALSVLLLTGCQKSAPMSEQPSTSLLSSSEVIGFNTYTGRPVTKATALDTNFNVESFLSGSRTLYFPSTAYRYASGKYTGDTTRYWPADATQNLDFYAVSPLTYTNTSATDEDLTPTTDSTIVVTKTDGTTDIVASRLLNAPNGTTPAAVNLTFGHKLTKVSFTVAGKDTTKKYEITDFKLNANSTSTYKFGESDTWDPSSDEYRYDYVSSPVTFSWTSKASSLGTKYLIPNQAANLTAAIWYKVSDGETLIIDHSTDSVKLTLPVTDVWGINKNVVYNLTIDPSSDSKSRQIEFNTVTLEEWDTEVNKPVAVPPAPSPLLSGKFSVSSTKKVNFTRGNLYWNGSAWKVEAKQYDFRNMNGLFGDAAVINGATTTTPSGTVGSLYWTKTAAASYAASYDDGTCTATDKFFCDGSDAAHTLTIDDQSGLYALSTAEWKYLLSSTDDSGRGDGDSKFKYGVTVDSKGNCLIIAPDGYTGTIASSYTAVEWTDAESAGLVCLPAAGCRVNSDVYYVGDYGYYWSSTPSDSDYAYSLFFGGSDVNPAYYFYRFNGPSVRLVCSAE